MKQIIMTLVALFTVLSAAATTLDIKVLNFQKSVHVSVYCDDGSVETINSDQKFIKIKLEKNHYYTLVFKSGERTKYLYVDTMYPVPSLFIGISMKKGDAILSTHCDYSIARYYITSDDEYFLEETYPKFRNQ